MSQRVELKVQPRQVVQKIGNEPVTVNVIDKKVALLTIGTQGPPGPPGHSTKLMAAVVLSGHRAIATDDDGRGVYADKDSPRRPLGISTGAAAEDAEITVQTFGEMSEPSWNWTLEQPIYLGSNGVLTQTPPTSGYLIALAFPITPTSIFVSVGQSFLRS